MEASKEFKQAWREKRKEIRCPEKGASNDHFRSKYRSWEDTEKALSDAGVEFYFELHNTPDQAGVSWVVELDGEEATVATCMVDKMKRDPQATGGCYTYAMRYAVQVHLGWGMPDVDDDGNNASGIGEPEEAPLSPEQIADTLIATMQMQKSLEAIDQYWANNHGEFTALMALDRQQYERAVQFFSTHKASLGVNNGTTA